ncbi:MAG: FAD-dependent oxidoreductase [Candidatus Bathyarchaeota archaeon]|nr:FAD-dependent oxidoreductase [Candidatus Bathyarchaeota archaeon]MDH5787020.1 FAD-dependent oxidoreductase [Candidatus Bathyarchaeota archaeon]
MPFGKGAEKCYPPCRKACPAEVNIQAYIALASQGKFHEALQVIRKYIPLPAVCGRVCFSPCEEECTRKDIDEALSIRAIKRLITDYELKTKQYQKASVIPRKYEEKIAVIGSGPAGLAVAYELVKMGYPVTVLEKAPKPGGMLRECIPEYRLPKRVLDAEIQYLTDLGVEIKTKSALGKDVTIEGLFSQGYKAVFLAIGAQECLSLNVEGENLGGVAHSLEFLRDVNYGERINLGDKVAVIGGGNVALDAARTAKRLGADEVTIIYRRSEEEMPAHRREVDEAKQEGVNFLFLASPKRFLGKNGDVASIECVRMNLGSPDETGRKRPIPIDGSEFKFRVNTVILAIGEKPDISFLPKEVEVTRRNTIIADSVTLETKMPGVFAGGDAVTGPASVIEAIAAGKKAAISINRYLRCLDLKTGREETIFETKWVKSEKTLEKKLRKPLQLLSSTQRSGNFQEVELGFDLESGFKETHRCLFCGPCAQCLELEDLCEPDDVLVDEDRCIACANCEKICGYGAIQVEKSVAKVNYDLCKGCGTCAVECPVMAISMSNFTNEKILKAIREAPKIWRNDTPHFIAFVCNWCHGVSIDQLRAYANTQIIPVKCVGRVDPLHVLQAFWTGADGILILGCHSSDCHYTSGTSVADKRVEQTKKWLKAVGIEPERLRIEKTCVDDNNGLNETIVKFASNLKEAGPNPLQKHSS